MGLETGRRGPDRREVGEVWQPLGRTEQWWEGNWECPGQDKSLLGVKGAKCGEGGAEAGCGVTCGSTLHTCVRLTNLTHCLVAQRQAQTHANQQN